MVVEEAVWWWRWRQPVTCTGMASSQAMRITVPLSPFSRQNGASNTATHFV